jgi:hypothetical protein
MSELYLIERRDLQHFGVQTHDSHQPTHAANYRVDISIEVKTMDKLSVLNDFTKCKIQ